MKRRNHRVFRLLASAVAAALLAAPVNAAAGNGGESVEPTSQAPIVVRVDGGFDWVSAGVGAAGGFGLVLVAGTATSALRHRRRVDGARA